MGGSAKGREVVSQAAVQDFGNLVAPHPTPKEAQVAVAADSSTASRRKAPLPAPDVPLQLDQVIKRIGGAQLAGVDQAHQHVAHLRTVQVLSEAEWRQRVHSRPQGRAWSNPTV